MVMGGQRHAPAALPPGMTRYPLYRKLGRPHGRSGRVLKISPTPGFDRRTVQPVASRYTDWAIAAHFRWYDLTNLTIHICAKLEVFDGIVRSSGVANNVPSSSASSYRTAQCWLVGEVGLTVIHARSEPIIVFSLLMPKHAAGYPDRRCRGTAQGVHGRRPETG
jgi:hypothetical protein